MYLSEPKNKYDEVKLSQCSDASQARFLKGNTEIKVKFISIEPFEKILTNEYDEINEKEVKEYVCSLLENANKIYIEYEPLKMEEDKYGRIEAWVYVDDVLLQENLVSLGYAKVAYVYDEYTYNDILIEKESKAIEEKLGGWQEKEEEKEEPIQEPQEEQSNEKGIFERIWDVIVGIFNDLLGFIDNIIDNIL